MRAAPLTRTELTDWSERESEEEVGLGEEAVAYGFEVPVDNERSLPTATQDDPPLPSAGDRAGAPRPGRSDPTRASGSIEDQRRA